MELSNNLPLITKEQNELAFAKCFDSYAVQSRKSIFCLDCGHTWKVTDNKKTKNVTCQNCRKKLVFNDKYSNGLKETDYYQIITTADKISDC